MNTSKTVKFSQLTCTQKQQLADKFLDIHPMRLQNTLVEYVLQKSFEDMNAPFSYNDITNNVPTANIEVSGEWLEITESERDEMLEELQEKLEALEENEDYEDLEEWEKITNDIQELEDASFDNYPEIYQWFSCSGFSCSDWLIRELEDRGQCTLDNEFWGRQCCGQSVALDSVMQEIAFDWFVNYGEEGLTQEQMIELNLA